ncbi:hypothetical protein R0K18_27535, partial [Pantoea sp. SIMBA_133]
EKDVQTQLETARKKLYSEREKRVHPYKDDKILTSWNMLMIAAFAKAGRAFQHIKYTQLAEKSYRFIEENMVIDGRLMARYRDGEVKFKAYHD